LSRQERAIIAYLAMQPNFSETRERLGALIWDSSTDSQARQNLRQCLLVLRKKFASANVDVMRIERHTVGLNAETIAVDAREFLAHAESTDLADLEQATACYPGDFLERFNLDVEPFDEWARTERARLNAAAIRVFERCAILREEAGDCVAALKAAERLTDLMPLNEGAHRILLRLLARHRGPEAALAHFEVLNNSLQADADAQPEAETIRLIKDIQSGALPRSANRSSSTGSAPSRAHESAATIGAKPDGAVTDIGSRRPRQPFYFIAGAAVGLAVLISLGAISFGAFPRIVSWVSRSSASLGTHRAGSQSWQPPRLPTAASDQTAALANSAIYPLIVLPFRSHAAADSAEDRIAARLTSDLINDLSRAPNARVISAQTSRQYGGRDVDVAETGKQLGVKYVVEGDVQLDGAKLRLNVSLTDASSRLLIWSDRFSDETPNQIAVRDDVTRAIARRLQINLVAAEDRRRPPGSAARPDVDALLAKGWAATTRISLADNTTGADTYFSEVLALDPDNVSALIGLSAFHIVGIAMFLGEPQRFDLVKAEEMLKRAIALNPNSSLAYYYLGVLDKIRAQPEAALGAFTKCLELNPSYAPAYAQVGQVLSRVGRLSEALEHVRYAIRLSPKDHNLGIWNLFGGQIELELGHDEAATEWLSRAAESSPRSPFIQASLAAIYALRGDKENEAIHVAKTHELAPWLTNEQMIGRIVGLTKPGAEPRRLIDGLREAFAVKG
jgi:TolB-like protein/DNA-binding SARP family transcriptional activator